MRINRRTHSKGFSARELLIVLSVMTGISLGSAVAYEELNDRAEYTNALSDLHLIHTSLQAHKERTGSFPAVDEWRYYCEDASDFIPGLSETESIPKAPCSETDAKDDSWAYISDGAGYKLLYSKASTSSGFKKLIPENMKDAVRWSSKTTWGFWTDNHRDV